MKKRHYKETIEFIVLVLKLEYFCDISSQQGFRFMWAIRVWICPHSGVAEITTTRWEYNIGQSGTEETKRT